MFAKDREQSRFPIPGTGLAFGSGGIPQGRFMFTDPNTGAVQNIVPNSGVSNPRYDGSAGCNRSDDYHCFTTADRFNFAEYNMVLTPSERKGLFGQFRFDITDNVQWYIKALGNRRESTNQAGPEPLFFGPDGATGNPLADNIVVSRLNPYNPFGFDLVSGDNMSLIGRRPVEGGARVFKQEVNTTYVATGLVGNFHAADRSWYWDVNGMYSKNKAEQTNYGSYNIYNVNLALGDRRCARQPGLRAAEHLRRRRLDHPGHAEVDPAGGARPQPERAEPVHRQPVQRPVHPAGRSGVVRQRLRISQVQGLVPARPADGDRPLQRCAVAADVRFV